MNELALGILLMVFWLALCGAGIGFYLTYQRLQDMVVMIQTTQRVLNDNQIQAWKRLRKMEVRVRVMEKKKS